MNGIYPGSTASGQYLKINVTYINKEKKKGKTW